MKFVIPSYQRYDKLKLLTLTFLNTHNIKKTDTYIFVRMDDSDLQKYLSLKDDGYNVEVIDVKGIGKTHNYITNRFEEGEYIVELDDDIIDVVDKNRQSIVSLTESIDEMLSLMRMENISYGGLYQVDNNLFMSKQQNYTTDLRYLLGIFRIRKIDKSIVLRTDFAEDFENTILHYIKDGKILKNNWLCAKTKNYADGGCKATGRDINTERIDKEYLANKYPEYCKLFQRKNGHWDLRLKHYKN